MSALRASILHSSTTSNRRDSTMNLQNRISLPHIENNSTFQQMEKQLSPNVEAFIESDPMVKVKLYAILEAVADRVEMHKNEKSGTVFFSNQSTLSLSHGGHRLHERRRYHRHHVIFDSVVRSSNGDAFDTEQDPTITASRRATQRGYLFKQLQNQTQTILSVGNPTSVHVKEMMDKVLALDKSFPLPLLGGAMLDKFPDTVEPAV